MNWNKRMYRDRFGNEWSARIEATVGMSRRVSFTCKELRLISEENGPTVRAKLTLTRLQELFCDAERVIEQDGETWLVGYRRPARGCNRTQDGMYTWFRSAQGEVRYATGMLHFRHMPRNQLCVHLAAATPTAGTNTRVRWVK